MSLRPKERSDCEGAQWTQLSNERLPGTSRHTCPYQCWSCGSSGHHTASPCLCQQTLCFLSCRTPDIELRSPSGRGPTPCAPSTKQDNPIRSDSEDRYPPNTKPKSLRPCQKNKRERQTDQDPFLMLYSVTPHDALYTLVSPRHH